MGGSGSKEDANGNEKRLSSNGSVSVHNGKNKSGTGSAQIIDREKILGPKPEELTNEEKELIRDSWKDVEQSVAKVGVVLFIKLFETHPDVQESFMFFRGEELKNIEHSKQLRNHALRVMGFVQKAVSRLDEPEKFNSIAIELGCKHCQYSVNPVFVDLVGPQFISAIQGSLESKWEASVEQAWLRLFLCITYNMKSQMIENSVK